MRSTSTGLVLLAAMLAGCATESATNAPTSIAEAAPKAAPSAPSPARRETVIAAGTSLTVRTTSTLSTASAKSGENFDANLAEPLRDGERILVPKGAEVEGRVINSDPGGRVKGRASISVQLTALRVDGKTLPISTNSIVRAAKATKKRDAAKIGIGAGIGAAIGAIAGGGKGAAIGAGAGGGAGTGVVLATRGSPAVIPSESVLIFSLRAPLTIP